MESTGTPIYSCNLCGKSWDVLSKLEIHVRSHTGERPYSCDQCGKTFSVMSNLNRHVRTVHSIQKPFLCQLCGKTFNQNSNLKRHHVKVHHLTGIDETESEVGSDDNGGGIHNGVGFMTMGQTMENPVLATVIDGAPAVDEEDASVAQMVVEDSGFFPESNVTEPSPSNATFLSPFVPDEFAGVQMLKSAARQLDEADSMHQDDPADIPTFSSSFEYGSGKYEPGVFAQPEMPIAIRPPPDAVFSIFRPRAVSGSSEHSIRNSFTLSALGAPDNNSFNDQVSIRGSSSDIIRGSGSELFSSAGVFKPVNQSPNFSFQ
jgi:uncharacterized C2H2 Zn-finger protein